MTAGDWSTHPPGYYEYVSTSENLYIYRFQNNAAYDIAYNYSTGTWLDEGYANPASVSQSGTTVSGYTSSNEHLWSFTNPF